jgi:hypothetical protein
VKQNMATTMRVINDAYSMVSGIEWSSRFLLC